MPSAPPTPFQYQAKLAQPQFHTWAQPYTIAPNPTQAKAKNIGWSNEHQGHPIAFESKKSRRESTRPQANYRTRKITDRRRSISPLRDQSLTYLAFFIYIVIWDVLNIWPSDIRNCSTFHTRTRPPSRTGVATVSIVSPSNTGSRCVVVSSKPNACETAGSVCAEMHSLAACSAK